MKHFKSYVHLCTLSKKEIENFAHSDTLRIFRYLICKKINQHFKTASESQMSLKIWWKLQLPLPRKKHMCVYAHEVLLKFYSSWTLWGLPMDPPEVHELWVKNLCNKPTLCFGKVENLTIRKYDCLSFPSLGACIWKEGFFFFNLTKKLWLSDPSCLALKWGPISFGSNPKLLVSWLSKCLTTIDTLMKSKWVKFNTSFSFSLQMFLIRTLKKSLEA